MCGLAAIFAYHGAAPPVDERELVAIRDAMAARGPDNSESGRNSRNHGAT